MSYSFSVRCATKVQAMERVVEELDKVVTAQPIHAVDRKQAQAAAEAFVGVIPDPNEQQAVSVYVSGSVSWRDGNVVTSAGVNVSASVVAKQ